MTNQSFKLAVGTYTKKEGHVDGKAQGVYLLEMDQATGKLSPADTITQLINPSYLCVDGEYVYAVNELADNSEAGAGTLTQINLNDFSERQTVRTEGHAPCHVIKVTDQDHLVSANYMGVVSLFQTKPSLALVDTLFLKGTYAGLPRQESSHPHMAMMAPDHKTILISDLGMDDVIHLQIQDGKLAELTRTKVDDTSGPRHMTTLSNKIVYLLNELNHSVHVYEWKGASTPMELKQKISTVPERNENISPAAIHLHPNKKFLYSSNRGIKGEKEQSISLFAVLEEGTLEYVERYPTGGLIPRDFAISPDGKFLMAANQDSDNIVTFEIDQHSGKLIKTENDLAIKTPVCLKFY